MLQSMVSQRFRHNLVTEEEQLFTLKAPIRPFLDMSPPWAHAVPSVTPGQHGGSLPGQAQGSVPHQQTWR